MEEKRRYDRCYRTSSQLRLGKGPGISKPGAGKEERDSSSGGSTRRVITNDLDYLDHLDQRYSKWGLRPGVATASPGNPVGLPSLDPNTDLLDPNLHFNETPPLVIHTHSRTQEARTSKVCLELLNQAFHLEGVRRQDDFLNGNWWVK